MVYTMTNLRYSCDEIPAFWDEQECDNYWDYISYICKPRDIAEFHRSLKFLKIVELKTIQYVWWCHVLVLKYTNFQSPPS